MERKANINYGLIGMNRTGFLHQLDEKSYTFQLNGNLEIDEAGGISLTNEHSNLLCSRFKPGYKVVGNKFDINSDRVYFFITNPETRHSEIGYVPYFHNVEDSQDILQDCNCTYENILSTPLEDQEQLEGCSYVTLLSDECNSCLNFDIKRPIKKIVLKGEKFFRTLYWTDGYNPPRYLQLNNLEQYHYNGEDICGEIICGDGIEVENPQTIEDCQTCLDCEKLRIFKRFSIPHIEPSIIQFGGNLPMGTYEFLIAYSDNLGNEISEYFSITNTIPIFDTNNYILNQTQLADRTNLAISLNVTGLDKNFQYYKVAVIQRTDITGETTVYEEGVHPITDTNIVYTTEIGKQRMTLQELFAQKPVFKTWRGLTAANNYLFGYGYTVEKEWNLQPVVNLLGAFVKWQTYQAKEGIYSDGVLASKYRGYMRDEVYPFSIRFGTKDGYWTANFPLISRPPYEDEMEQIVFESNGKLISSDRNAQSILDFAPNCSDTNRLYRWQYYNTATDEGYCVSYDLEDFDTIVRTTEEVCKVKVCFDAEGNPHGCDDSELCVTPCSDVIDTIEGTIIKLPIDSSDFRGLKNWFKENKDLVRYCCEGTTTCYPDQPSGSCPTPNSCNPEGGYPDIICQLATNTYPEFTCTPSLPFKECDSENPESGCFEQECNEDCLNPNECLPPTFVPCSEDIYIKQVIDEAYYLEEKIWAEGEEPDTEYVRTEPFGNCTMYIDGTGEGFDGGRLVDFYFYDGGGDSPDFNLATVLRRITDMMYNDSCQNAAELFEKQYSNFNYFLGYQFQDNCEGVEYDRLLTDYPSNAGSVPTPESSDEVCFNLSGEPPFFEVVSNIGFTDKIAKGALWFKIKRDDLKFVNEGEEPSVIFEVTKAIDSEDNYPSASIKLLFEELIKNENYRITLLSDCNTLISSEILHKDSGYWKMFTETDFDDANTDTLYVAIDSPIFSIKILSCIADDPRPYNCNSLESKVAVISPINGCFNVIKRPKEYKCAEITFDRIEISKKEIYEATCRYIVPFLNDCEPSPFMYGEFAYHESIEEYPNNDDLYNSSNLVISESDISEEYREKFEDFFVSGYTGSGNYYLSPDTDFRCKPIRHFRFPDNTVAPFIFDQPTGDANDTIIYPIGITVDDNIINSFLDVAVKNNLISQEQRDSITNYELFRGDRTIHKSILYKGIANDMYRYFDKGKEWWFRNFPYNSLGENQLIYENNFRGNLIQHPFDSEGNNKFSIIAPEVYYNQPSSATEIVTEGYQLGYSQGAFKEVDGHSKWVILGDDAKDLASTLATLEVAFESVMNIGDAAIGMATSMWSGWTAFSWGFGFSIAGHVAITIANVASALLFKYARYKYEWLQLFKNNGTPYNFANYYISSGKYNFFVPNSEEESYLRGLAVGKYIKPGNAIINDEKGRKVINVNNINRETSFFISFGAEYGIDYPSFYSGWDNVDSSSSSASRYLSSDVGCDNSWVSNRRIGSPYMSVKVYNPAQYGAIDSIKWIPINYNGVLSKNYTPAQCKSIFGGDVFITRTSFKTKFPLFLSDATKLPDRTPIDYFLYSNIGSTRFYASYETPITQIEQGRAIPMSDSVYMFNCPDEETTYANSFYVKPTNNRNYKFFLYYYGIPYFFTESTINSDYRYGGVEPHEQFYPNVDIEEWTQENKTSILHNNLFNYNNTYSKDTTPIGARTLPSFYNTTEWSELYEYPNGVVWSQQDNSEQDLRDPWLVFRPLDKHQFSYEYGKLIDMTGIESFQVLGRFENNALIFNAVDTIADRLTQANWVLGTGGIFATRPTEFSHTELGETGTQTTELVTTEFGHFWADAKRGKVFQLLPNAKGLVEISGFKRNGSPSGMMQWFKRHLPFKALRNRAIEGLDESAIALDNKYNSLGLNMWWDSKFKRLFLTKRDFIIEDPCVKYSDELGFYIDETECYEEDPVVSCPLGYEYNEETEMCELITYSPPCPSDDYIYDENTNTCTLTETTPPQTETEIITHIICPEGYTYNPEKEMCELSTTSPVECPEGYTYNTETGLCENNSTEPVECPEGYTYNSETNECELEECILDLVLVLDESGSMDETEFEQMQDFFTGLISSISSQITAGDIRVSVIRFSNCVNNIQSFTSNLTLINNAINQPQIIGGTNIGAGLCQAYNQFIDNGRLNAIKKTVLYIDGIQNVLACSSCPYDTKSTIEHTFEMADLLKQESELILAYSGDELERFDVRTVYVDEDYPYHVGDPVPSPGDGVLGRMAWEASFDNLPTIADEILSALECDLTQDPYCPEGCTQVGYDCECSQTEDPECPDDEDCEIISDNCNCFYEEPPTIEQETIIHYSCPEGWEFDEETLTCERQVVIQGCDEDCELVNRECMCTTEVEPLLDNIKTPVDVTSFKDVSWTVSYSPIYDSWISYHSFTPDYSIAYNDFFQTGINNTTDDTEFGLWSHLLTNKSFQVYYGKRYPWTIEVPLKNEYVSKILEVVNINTSTFRYHNAFDIAERRKEGINKAVIYNTANNSGYLNLQYSDAMDDYKYPIQVNQLTQSIKATHNKGAVKFNYFFNRVIDQDNNVPIWLWDENEIHKLLNPQAVSFRSKQVLERMRGEVFLLRLTQDKSSQYKQMYKYGLGKEGIDIF